MRVGVMEGHLSEFDLAAVLQVVGLGRQYTGIEVQRSDGRAGTIFVKSGVIVSVHSPPHEGKQALFQLFGHNDGRFHVFRTETPKSLPQPLGAVQKLLMEAVNAYARRDDDRESMPMITVQDEGTREPSVLPFSEMEPTTSASLSPMPPEARPPEELKLSSIPPAPPRNGAAAAPPKPTQTAASRTPDAPLPRPPKPPRDARPTVNGHAAPTTNGRAPSASAASPAPPPPTRTAAAPAPSAPVAPQPAAPAARAPNATPSAQRPASPARRTTSIPTREATARAPNAILAVVSPKGGCGKTTIALNTAIALSRQGHRVVLVDTDVNGDVLSSINARSRATVGTFDILTGRGTVEQGLLPTILPNFRILPAVGPELPDPATLSADFSGPLRALLGTLARDAHVIVDTPSGMFGITRHVLTASTHALGVLQAELIAQRSFERFREALDGIPDEERPAVLGVVLNMLQMRHTGSLSVLQSMCANLPPEWLFETSFPRHNAIVDATAQGVPVRHLDERTPPAIAFLFDTFAGEIVQRLRLGAHEYRPLPLLL